MLIWVVGRHLTQNSGLFWVHVTEYFTQTLLIINWAALSSPHVTNSHLRLIRNTLLIPAEGDCNWILMFSARANTRHIYFVCSHAARCEDKNHSQHTWWPESFKCRIEADLKEPNYWIMETVMQREKNKRARWQHVTVVLFMVKWQECCCFLC